MFTHHVDKMSDGCIPSDLLQHVYSFLVQCGYPKAAKALQKATDETLVVQAAGEAGLLEFFAYYQKRHAGKRTAVTMEEEEEEEDLPPKKKKKVTEEVMGCVGSEVNGGSAKKEKKRKKKKEAQDEAVPTDVERQSGDVVKDGQEREAGESDFEAEDARCAQAMAESTPNTMTVTNDEMRAEQATTSTGRKKGKKGRVRSTVPFRRVSDNVEVDPRLMDNSFEAKTGAFGSWGARANNDLKFTKGKSFRHEKTKKKRGTYKGGAIDTSVCSIKFDSE